MPDATERALLLDYSKVLVTIFELMLRGGLRKSELLPICISSLKRAETRVDLGLRSEPSDLVTVALVLDAWHRNRRFLTTRGLPKPLRLYGPSPSVEALVKLQKVQTRASEVVRHLRKVRLIVRCGPSMYKPTSDSAVISARNPLVLQHVGKALSTFVDTVGRNVRNSAAPARLIERFAEVPDLPRCHVNAFQNFTQMQGRNLLRTVNDWLESRRVLGRGRQRPRKTVRAGIHTYAYVIPVTSVAVSAKTKGLSGGRAR